MNLYHGAVSQEADEKMQRIIRDETQNGEILKLLKVGSITPMDALREIGCFRLAARIHDIRSAGYVINTKMRFKNGKSYAEYTLAGHGSG